MRGLEANTYSIVARCERSGELGAAVASAVPAVGAICLVNRPGVGIVSTQSWVNPYLAEAALDAMAEGADAATALEAALGDDKARNFRQVGAIAARGAGAAWSGSGCTPWCGERTGRDFAVQGNMLTGAPVLDAMAAAYTEDAALPLESRLMTALTAGQAAGGDKRGRQSAALVVANTEGYRRVDLRVDEHPDPVDELTRVLKVATSQLLPFVEGMPKRGKEPAPAPDAVVDMLLQSPPDRPGGGGAREPVRQHGVGVDALHPALLTDLCLPPERLREVAESFRVIRTEIDRMRKVGYGETHPAVVFRPFRGGGGS